jgi:periplasmic protein TonB
MFEDSLIESQGRIRTKSKWFAIGSFFAQASLLLLLILFPLLHPQALPKQSMERLLLAPPPPRAPVPASAHAAVNTTSHQQMPRLEAQMQAPRTIPTTTRIDEGEPSMVAQIGGLPTGDGPGVIGGINLSSPAPTVTITKPPAPKHPLAVSLGVAAGQLLRPIQPVYPAIAKAARIQGTVVIEATISRQGTIENLRVIEGPPMLRQAAIDAVAAAQYRPFLLNGEPVEVQTSIHVIFSLGG